MTGGNAAFVQELLGGDTPEEKKSDCGHCVMCAPEEPVRGVSYFDPKVRCCSFEPSLPNYMAGAILRDQSAENAFGRSTVAQRMARGVDTAPWGVRQSRKFSLLYSSNTNLFGRATELSCPHLREGDLGCSIWRYRPGVCSTWYCKHDRGRTGSRFWLLVARLCREVEFVLGAWCVSELHEGEEALRDALQTETGPPRAQDLGAPLDKSGYRELWGAWAGREAEFFQLAAGLVDDLRWSDVERIGGLRLQAVVKMTRRAYAAATTEEPPERVTVGPFRILSTTPGKRMVETYSGLNPLLMPDSLFRLLPYFDGRPTGTILEEIRVKENVRVHPALVRRMADHGILTEPEATE